MRIGIFGDAHDHLDNVRHAVNAFNQANCDLVVFAGDFCSPIVIPPLRKLMCRMLACFGDNDANKVALHGGMRIIGEIAEPPCGFETSDGVKILLTHATESVRGMIEGADVIIAAHSHRPAIEHDQDGRLFINPGETSGWTYRKPMIALLDTDPLNARLVPLPEMPPEPAILLPEAEAIWRAGWNVVAEVGGSDKEMHDEVERFLDSQGIENAVEGSKAYAVFVLKNDAKEAIRLLHENAKFFPGEIWVLESVGSTDFVKYNVANDHR